MKRITFSLSALLVLSALFTLTSCNKEEVSNGTQFRASMENCTSQNSKTTLSGTALNWQNDDRIAVYGTDGCGIYSATPQTPATTAIFDNVSGETGDPTFRAFYPTTLTTDGVNITLPATQTYVENSIHEFPMYAESSDNTLSFKNLCGALKLHLTANVNISTIAITAADEINGTFSIDYNAGDPQLTPVSGSNTTTFTCATAQSIASGKDFFIYLPAGNYSGLQIELNTNDGRYCVKTANTTISVTRSQYTLITLNANNLQFIPLGSKGGLFTINADGDQVWFSQGNLLYVGSATTPYWKFADNQYSSTGSNSTNLNSNRDHFAWATSGFDHGSGMSSYQPWVMSPSSIFNAYGNSSYDLNQTGCNGTADWGYNAIYNAGNVINEGWRTLTKDEWNYLFYMRTNASVKWGLARVAGMNGIIILPDLFIDPYTNNGNSAFVSGVSTGFNTNIYTAGNSWDAMEAAGAVFLPAAGYSYGTRGNNFGDYNTVGRYWSSTHSGNSDAYGIYFDGNGVNATFSIGRASCHSVRLVRDND